MSKLRINPTLKISLPGAHGVRGGILQGVSPHSSGAQIPFIIEWIPLNAKTSRKRPADNEDLIALKIVSEQLDPDDIAHNHGISLSAVESVIERAVREGILIAPPSLIKRDRKQYHPDIRIPEAYLSSPVFTIQWHITQDCNLHCRHCYDRSDRSGLSVDRALSILADFKNFCSQKNVKGAVSFSGGNPFLHKDFFHIYAEAARLGFITAVLGNPVSAETLEKLISIKRPSFFQVSLEGVPSYNDYMRGSDNFTSVIEFLKLLREYNISSMVMLTLTRDNLKQVIPLAGILRGLTDVFHFNRLSAVGQGSEIMLPEKEAFEKFLSEYIEAAKDNPVMGFKENLFNVQRILNGMGVFGGCTGYGCGAAFNFVSILSDGEVHACRKFPSLIGNVYSKGLLEIYDSEKAERYRKRPAACRNCKISPICGGCLAVIQGSGLDISLDKDPFCNVPTEFDL